MCLKWLFKKNIRNFSHLASPVQAAHYAHSIKNYDNDVGCFRYNDQRYEIGEDGYYKLVGYYSPDSQ